MEAGIILEKLPCLWGSLKWTCSLCHIIGYVNLLSYLLAVNRRLDEWVKLEQLDLDSVETVVDEKVEDKVHSSLT